MSSSTLSPLSSTTLDNSIIPVPSLSTSGWVTSLHQKADLLLAHLFAADKSQTFIYKGQVTSMQWLVQQYSNDPNKMANEMQDALGIYFLRYYPDPNPIVEVSVMNIDPTTTNAVNLNIWIQVIENGQTYSIAQLLNIVDSKFTLITNAINNGL